MRKIVCFTYVVGISILAGVEIWKGFEYRRYLKDLRKQDAVRNEMLRQSMENIVGGSHDEYGKKEEGEVEE